jgi:hypothetical protein
MQEIETGMASKGGQIMLFMKANLKMTRHMAKASLSILMGIAMREIGWRTEQKGLAGIAESLGDFIRVDGKMMSLRALELNHGAMAIFTKESFEMD